MKIFFFEIKNTLLNLLKINYFLYMMIGFVVTYFLVMSGFDWWYFLHFRNSEIENFFFPGILIGGVLPIILPIGFFVFGKIKKNSNYINWAGLLGQSAFLGWLSSSILKAFTGRVQPNMHDLVTDISHNFNFGFWRHGIFWGWPSSHTAVAFSVVFAVITALINREKILKNSRRNKIYLGILFFYAFYIGIAVSLSIHWFSDFVMGGILGTVVGHEVGKSFRKKI